jgi:hypothetical protein
MSMTHTKFLQDADISQAKPIINAIQKTGQIQNGFYAPKDGSHGMQAVSLSIETANTLSQTEEYEEVKNVIQNSNGGGIEQPILTTAYIIPEVIKQLTAIDDEIEYQKIINLMPVKRYQPFAEYPVQLKVAREKPIAYDRAIQAIDSHEGTIATEKREYQKSERRYGKMLARVNLLHELRNQNLAQMTNLAIDEYAASMHDAYWGLKNQKIKNILCGLETVSSSAGLLNTNVVTNVINTATGWASFTSYDEARNLVISLQENLLNTTALNHGRYSKLVISLQQSIKLNKLVTAIGSNAGTNGLALPLMISKKEALLQSFKEVMGNPNFEIVVLKHFNKSFAQDKEILGLDDADYSVLIADDQANFLDDPMDPLLFMANNGGYDSIGNRTSILVQQYGELRIGRSELITTFKNTNFVV